jgi:hypothetical protein
MVTENTISPRRSGKRSPRFCLPSHVLALRADALERGEKVYDPQMPCKNAHIAWRYAISNECVECLRLKNAQKRGSNPDTARRGLLAPPGVASNKERREAAKHAGSSTFESAVPCRKCGTAQRTTRTNNCVACKVEYTRQRNITHAVQHRANVREWQRANPERVVDNHRRWYAENMEKTKENVRAFAKNNPHLLRAYQHSYRARKVGAEKGDKRPIVSFCKWLLTAEVIACYWCRRELRPDERQIDHIIPLLLGGPHSVGNLCVSCQPCNNRKGAKAPEAFAGQAEFRLG